MTNLAKRAQKILREKGMRGLMGKFRRLISSFPIRTAIRVHNLLIDVLSSSRKDDFSSDLTELAEVKRRARKRSDISDHFVSLFIESLEVNPEVIVELGVRRGESTFVLERVAKLCNSKLISVDIADFSEVSSFEDWHFIQMDDIEFAKVFRDWCHKRGIKPKIDVLFIDTSHLYEHTLQEIQHWFPYLSNNAKVFFHDTNSPSKYYFRRDHSLGIGGRYTGVIRALEEYFDKDFNEKKEFVDIINGWIIKHDPHCNGFTILAKI